MQITERVELDRTILTLSGRFDAHARLPFQAAIEQAKRSNPNQIILDFSNVSFINSVGLGLIMLALKDLKEVHICLSLQVVEGYVHTVLTEANVGQNLPISVIDAQPPLTATPKASSTARKPLTPPLVFESTDMQELLLPILEMLEQNTLDLPPLSEIAKKVLVFVNDPKATAAQLHALIEQDPVLTARIFKMTNSAAYGTHREIESLAEAIAWLGLNSVAMLAFALSVQSGVFYDRGYEREVRALWAHAIATAFYAKFLAQQIGKDQDGAFLCGLLHSLGKLCVVHTVNQSRSPSAPPIPWSVMLTIMEQSYIEVGRKLGEAWSFPSSVKEAIILHQHFSYHLATHPSHGAAITCLAKHIATNHLDAVEMTEEELRALPVAAALQIPPDVMDEILGIKPVIQSHIESLLV